MKSVRVITKISLVADIILAVLGQFVSSFILKGMIDSIVSGELSEFMSRIFGNNYQTDYERLDLVFIVLFSPFIIMLVMACALILLNTVIVIFKLIKDIRILKATRTDDKYQWEYIINQSRKYMLPIFLSFNTVLISTDIIRLVLIKKHTGVRVI